MHIVTLRGAQIFRQVAAHQEEVLGADHHDCYLTRSNLAKLLKIRANCERQAEAAAALEAEADVLAKAIEQVLVSPTAMRRTSHFDSRWCACAGIWGAISNG